MTAVAFFATSAKGLEEVLADELRALGVSNVLPGTGGVHFHGCPADGYRACLWLRTANRVLLPLGTFPCQSAGQLYEEVRKIPWEAYLTPAMTLALNASVRDSALTHSRYVALKGKDAIVDRLREVCGCRPTWRSTKRTACSCRSCSG